LENQVRLLQKKIDAQGEMIAELKEMLSKDKS